jgi:lipid-binding SYLF domain-containing protein
MRRFSVLILIVLLAAPLALGASKAEERLGQAATVMHEILQVPDDIPRELLDRAECVLVFPSVKKGAFGFGVSYGRGVMVCRSGKDYMGPWGPPAMYALEGGSFGFQLGGQAKDFVLLVMNPRGADSVLKSKVKLGADASIAGGPKGRTADASTDAYMRAEILSYSRSRGLFAGVSLEGSTLRPDNNANEELYGGAVTAETIVKGGTVKVPKAGEPLVRLLQQASPKNKSD